MGDAPFWFLLTGLCICVHAFFSMMEMAIVSFNKVRLEYYVAKNDKKARWIYELLSHPASLFGTTLIGVNVALQIGSECSRQFYLSIGLPASAAPVTQIIIVLLFAELAPMFAARHYPEHVGRLGIPLIYVTSRLMRPFIFLIGVLTKTINRVLKIREVEPGAVLSRDELQGIIEESDDADQAPAESQDFNAVVGNLFALRDLRAKDLMDPLDNVEVLPSSCTIGRMRQVLDRAEQRWVPIYHRTMHNIVGVADPRDLLRVPDHRQVREFARPPWFVTQHTKIPDVLHQFRRNNRHIAVILNPAGQAIGVLTLDAILENLFGGMSQGEITEQKRLIERTLPGSTQVTDFNAYFQAEIDVEGAQTLSEVMAKELGHQPEIDETVKVAGFEFKAIEMGLVGPKTIHVRTLSD